MASNEGRLEGERGKEMSRGLMSGVAKSSFPHMFNTSLIEILTE
jgi:hypothetical protein